MSCNIQKKTLDHFKEKGLIGDNRLVPTEKIDDFNAENEKLTQYAKDSKNVDLGLLFELKMTTIERSGNQGTLFKNRAIPNTKAFEALEKYNDDNQNNTFEKKLEDSNNSKPEIKSFIFNPEKISKRDINKDSFELNKDRDDIANILFGGMQTNTTANKVLRNALNHPHLDINDSGKFIIKSLLTSRAKIKFVSKEALKSGEDTYAQYDSNTRTITVNREILNTGNVYYALESILHEVIHDMTVHSLEAPKNDAQRAFRDNIIKALRYYNSKTDKSQLYGFTSEAEFIAEIMTNSEFREELKDIDNGNFFTKIINFIKSIFGISNDIPNVTDITRSIMEIIEKESNGYKSPLQNDVVLEKNTSEKSKKNQASKELQTKLTDVKSVINKILSSIEAVKKKSISSKGYDSKTQKKYDKIQNLLDKLQKEKAKDAVLEYLVFAEKELDSLIYGLETSEEADTLTNDYINRSRQYASIFNYVDDISKIVSRMKQTGKITRDEYNVIADSLDKVNGRYKRYITDSSNLSKNLVAKKFASYNTAPITRAKNKYTKEYKNKKISNKTLDQYVQEKIDENIDVITQEQYDEVRDQLEVVPKDISNFHFMLDNEKSIPSLLIHLSSLTLDVADAEVRKSSIYLRNLLVNANKEYNPTGSTNKARYGKLLSQDKASNYYLISKYKPEFLEAFNKVKNNIKDAADEFGENSDEHIIAKDKYKKWKKDNIINEKGNVNGFDGVIIGQKPISKWLDPRYTKLTKQDKTYLKSLEDSAIRADIKTKRINSLVNRPLKGENSLTIIKLPSVRRTDIDMLLSGKFVQLAKDKAGDLIKKRQDDTEYGELTDQDLENTIKVMSSMDGESRNTIPIHYRAPIDSKDQSLDLSTIFLLNETMATNFDVKSKIEADLTMLQDIVSEADVKQVDSITGFRKIPAYFGYNSKEKDTIIAPGDQSNVYKKLKSMLENRLYGITEISSNKILGLDVNAIANSISGYTADLTLGLNYLSAVPNLTQAKVQNFIEGVGLGTYSRADLRFAEKEYWKQMTTGGLNDIGALRNNNKINLLIEHFDLMGDFNVVKNLIEDNTKFRALMKKGTMHSLNSMSEHYAQSTLMLAILNSTKIKNNKGQYINKDGKIVAKEEAMTLYEAFDVEVDPKTKTSTLKLNSKAIKTSFSDSKLSDLGMIQHQNLIKKKVIDLHGQYDNKIQSHLQRHWYGKLLFMFRKWMLSSYKRRFRGIAHGRKEWDNLTEEQKQYDYSLQEYDEGTYTSFWRFLNLGIIESIKNLNAEIMTQNWENLTDKERANIYKTTREIAMIGVMLAGYMLTASLAEDDEENEELYYLLAFNFRRQVAELGQYANPLELMRTMRSPFASMTTLEKTGKLLYQVIGDPFEEYKTGDRKGEIKSWIKFKKLIPYVAQGERSAEQSLNFLETLSN